MSRAKNPGYGENDQTFVPFTVKEFTFIRDNFKSEDVECLEKMLDLCLMWQFRGNNSQSPIVVIEITKLILEGILFDQKYVINREVGILHPEQYARFIYGTVVLRLVNYINQMSNPVLKGGTYGNMFNSARHVGLPSWVVQMRHDVVHTHMPSLPELRKAVVVCRDWLYDANWKHAIELVFLPLNVPTTNVYTTVANIPIGKLQELLNEFCVCNMPNASPNSHIRLQHIILELKKMIIGDPKFVTITIANAFIIQTEQQMKNMGFDIKREGHWKIPGVWKKYWKEIIYTIQECSSMGHFMIYMSKSVLTSIDPFFQVQYAAWLSHLIEKLITTGRFISHNNLIIIAENMLKSKAFYKRDKFEYIIDSMKSHLSTERQNQLILSWDSNEDYIEINENTFMIEETEENDVNFALVNTHSSLGLTHGQTKEELNLCCTAYME